MTPDPSRNRAVLSGETMLRYRPPPAFLAPALGALSGACGERVHESCKYRAAGFPLGLQAGLRTRPIARAREWYLGFGLQVVELLVSGSVSGTLVPGLDRGAYADASEREGILGFPNGEFLGELLVETGLDVASVWRVGLQASLGVDVGQGDGTMSRRVPAHRMTTEGWAGEPLSRSVAGLTHGVACRRAEVRTEVLSKV